MLSNLSPLMLLILGAILGMFVVPKVRAKLNV